MESDYFSFYELPHSYFIDKNILRQKYIDKSRSAHPDFHTQSSTTEQNQALQDSLINNKAYKILNNDALRMRYYLELKGIILMDEKYQLPNEFLMEMMEINERIQEAMAEKNEAEVNILRDECTDLQKSLEIRLENELKELEKDGKADTLKNNLKENYYKQKYLLRIKESLNTFAAS